MLTNLSLPRLWMHDVQRSQACLSDDEHLAATNQPWLIVSIKRGFLDFLQNAGNILSPTLFAELLPNKPELLKYSKTYVAKLFYLSKLHGEPLYSLRGNGLKKNNCRT